MKPVESSSAKGKIRSCLAVVSLALALPGAFLSFQKAAAATDAQLWNEVKLSTQLTDRFDLIASGALRYSNDISPHDRTSWLFGMNFRATSEFTLTPSYSYILTDPDDDVKNFEHRFSLVAAMRLPFKLVEATFSTGIEYRLRNEQSDDWRVRPRLRLKHAVGPDSWNLAAYTADELFFDTRDDRWTRNRLFAGIERKMRRNWVIDLYYCRQHDFGTDAPDLNIIGITIRLSPDASASAACNDSEDE